MGLVVVEAVGLVGAQAHPCCDSLLLAVRLVEFVRTDPDEDLVVRTGIWKRVPVVSFGQVVF